MRNLRRMVGTVIAVLLIPSLILTAEAAMPPGKRVFTVARFVDGGGDPNKHYAAVKAMADYLAQELKDFGYDEGRALLTESQDELVRLFKDGQIDLISETVFAAANLVDDADAELLLKSHRKGADSYSVAFFARKDSGIRSLKDLRGRIIAFEDDKSTTGFLIPVAELLAKGHKLSRLSSPRDTVPPNTVGYVYSSGEEANSALMVHKHLAHASAFGDKDMMVDKSMPPAIRSDMKVFHTTATFPRSLMVVRRALDPAAKTRLKEALMKAVKDPDMKKTMKGYHNITDFEPLSQKDLQGYEAGRRLWKIFQTKFK